METLQAIADLIESALTSMGICVGGVWGYFLFRRYRKTSLRAELDLELTNALIPRSKRLLHVALRIINRGNVLLRVCYAEVRVRQVVPIPKDLLTRLEENIDPIPVGATELAWPKIVGREWDSNIGAVEIEPGESDLLHADFVIEDDISVIELYAFVRNPHKAQQDIGWTKTRLHTFTFGGKDERRKGKEQSV